MALTGVGALITISMAFAALSPRYLSRSGLGANQIHPRVRVLIGYTLALLLLGFGFFLAGVPIGDEAVQLRATTASQADTGAAASESPVALPSATSTAAAAASATSSVAVNSASTRTSGAFAGPPPGLSSPTPTGEVGAESTQAPSEAGTPAAAVPTDTPTATATSTATPQPTGTAPPSATATATATPTVSPTPTITPTPIEGQTAVINTGSSTLWIRRSPGGQTLSLVQGGDIVILMPGHANQGGQLWRQVMTVKGEVGWVQEEFLLIGG